ncbi:unnamed protein product, partial [Choristocarpus tenellus]
LNLPLSAESKFTVAAGGSLQPNANSTPTTPKTGSRLRGNEHIKRDDSHQQGGKITVMRSNPQCFLEREEVKVEEELRFGVGGQNDRCTMVEEISMNFNQASAPEIESTTGNGALIHEFDPTSKVLRVVSDPQQQIVLPERLPMCDIFSEQDNDSKYGDITNTSMGDNGARGPSKFSVVVPRTSSPRKPSIDEDTHQCFGVQELEADEE